MLEAIATGVPKSTCCHPEALSLEKVAVPNFGTFLVAKREARKGRNPATGKPINIKASKTVRFKVSTNLKKLL